ncbi:Bud site selection protein, Revert to axial protein 1 [Elasticomyces elasticus]|nr:Bud site selection protein, Revert to axial protein 1 [Elasticomyces elasticus]KAK3637286.1 Bud site selection protein, Revert to axial protein 1 [Elasticomyces elasticus]KAK4916441.1 Bud site selection protein, Revert to axial protein 1 [Elasticomyces elasticus]KAK5756012.1 Bud site selection protein, Revert to axial protein 1 [Elasticomyces elasticus]
MPEPITIATAVASLVTTGFKTGYELSEFISKVKDAPKEIERTRDELAAVNNGLCQLRALLDNPKTAPTLKSSRKEIESVLESCKGTFEELAKEAYKLSTGVWRKVGWVTSEGKIKQLCTRIESHKASLNLLLSILARKADARIEDRLERLNYLVGHIAKNHQKLSKQLKASSRDKDAVKPAAIETRLVADVGSGTEQPVLQQSEDYDPPTDASNYHSTTHHIEASTTDGKLVSNAKRSSIQITRRPYSVYSGSIASGVTDMSITDVDIEYYTRPLSMSSYAPSMAVSEREENVVALVDGLFDTKTTSPVPAKPQDYTLLDVLSRKTLEPYDLYHFYVFMRDTMRSVDFLDFYLDTMQHLALCRRYVRELKARAFIDEENDDESSIIESIVSDQYTDDGKDSDVLLSEYLRKMIRRAQTYPSDTNFSRTMTQYSLLGRPADASIWLQDLQASAWKVLRTYLLSGAEREIIIPEYILSRVTGAIEQATRCDPEVFDAARDCVFRAMERDAFPSFMRRRRAVISSLRYGSDEGLLSAFRNRGSKAIKAAKGLRRKAEGQQSSSLNAVAEE